MQLSYRRTDVMVRLLILVALTMFVQEAQAKPSTHVGFAARHRSLANVATNRGMSSRGVLFASPLAPIGTRLCVSSKRMPTPVCGTVVDVPQPQHRTWQLETRRYIEVSPTLATHLCIDSTGPPRLCPVVITVMP
jgi:hypothetical protein